MGICSGKQADGRASGRNSDLKYKDPVPRGNIPAGNEENNSIKFNLENMVIGSIVDIRQEYIFLSPPLGKGAYGEVRKAKHIKSDIMRAVKILTKKKCDEEEKKKFLGEVKILKTLDHPNIVRVIEYYEDTQQMYIITELCQGGELFDRIIQQQRFSEKKAKETMFSLLSAISYCHSLGIVHRDLKPENMLYETADPNSNLKIIDFGTSTLFKSDSTLDKKLGTVADIDLAVLHCTRGLEQALQREM